MDIILMLSAKNTALGKQLEIKIWDEAPIALKNISFSDLFSLASKFNIDKIIITEIKKDEDYKVNIFSGKETFSLKWFGKEDIVQSIEDFLKGIC